MTQTAAVLIASRVLADLAGKAPTRSSPGQPSEPQTPMATSPLHLSPSSLPSPACLSPFRLRPLHLSPKVDDWRAMVDCVRIDPAYDGQTFRIAHSDIPEKKTDFVQPTYTLDAPKGKTTVAVKIIDMLAEEVLVVREVRGNV